MAKATKEQRTPPTKPTEGVALDGTVAQPKGAAGMRHWVWNDVEREVMNPLLERQLIVGQDVMLARLLLRKGCIVPLHSHTNEQLSMIFSGALQFWIDGKEIVVRGGEVLTIPPNMPHKAEALEDTTGIDVFHPPRADWINKTDSYLRK